MLKGRKQGRVGGGETRCGGGEGAAGGKGDWPGVGGGGGSARGRAEGGAAAVRGPARPPSSRRRRVPAQPPRVSGAAHPGTPGRAGMGSASGCPACVGEGLSSAGQEAPGNMGLLGAPAPLAEPGPSAQSWRGAETRGAQDSEARGPGEGMQGPRTWCLGKGRGD